MNGRHKGTDMATATVGVVCERVRLEEKQLLAAFAAAGLEPSPFPPGAVPLAVTPGGQRIPRVMVDRGQNRVEAAAIMTACQAIGAIALDAGLAARTDRLTVAATLSAAGLPRPETRLTCSAEAAMATLADFGYPATVVPVAASGKPILILDVDTAEAVLEHRDVLGTRQEALTLVQAGMPAACWSVIVVGGVAVAVSSATIGEPLPDAARELAEGTATTLGAAMMAVEIARVGGELVIWDVDAVPEFRHAVSISEQTVAAALSELALARLAADPADVSPEISLISLGATLRREVGHGVVLTA
jgi:glutathione synthase/RimK-type ligase-like ATP-grasp enzyme